MTKEQIDTLVPIVHANAVAKGWWDEPKIKQKKALVISEIAEAIEAERVGRHSDIPAMQGRLMELATSFNPAYQISREERQQYEASRWKRMFERYVKDSIEDELADVAIRIMDLMANANEEFLPFAVSPPCDCLEDLLFYVAGVLMGNSTIYSTAILYVIRYCNSHGIDLYSHVTLKMKYNATRAYKHGKKY